MCLHDFRRAAATFLAMDAPEKIGLIPGVLQHASPDVASSITILRVRCRRGSALRHILPMRGAGCGARNRTTRQSRHRTSGIPEGPKVGALDQQEQDDCASRSRRTIMRVSIYARYSSDLQRAASIEDQVLVCTERVVREKWTLAATYTDRGISGASHLRPGYQKLLEGARKGEFDIVLAEALDRISRDQEHVASFFKLMSFAGIRIVTLTEGEISELHVGLKGTMNALFLKDLADKTRRGLRGRIEQGRSGGGLCYGYTIVENGERGGREIVQAEAAVVRRIFADFAAGKSPRRIAAELNREGTPGPGGRPWGDTTIRGHALRGTGVLRNELYVGRLVWNRLRYTKDPSTGRRVSRINPCEDWVFRDVPELRILDDNLWNCVQTRLGAIRNSDRVVNARATKFWTRRRPQHLLTGQSGLRRLRRPGRTDRQGLHRLLHCPSARNLHQSCKHSSKRNRKMDYRSSPTSADGAGYSSASLSGPSTTRSTEPRVTGITGARVSSANKRILSAGSIPSSMPSPPVP